MSTLYYAPAACRLHDMGANHPESPHRLRAIDEALKASGLLQRLTVRDAPMAERADLERIHSAEYVSSVEACVPQQGHFALDPDTLLNPYSWQAALMAAGAAAAATDAVIAGEARNAFCAIRPPGHHACPNTAMGFCLFNNVAVAAARALQVHGLQRVAVIDFDVHHGNGTEEAFFNEERVLMVSFFQHPFYPYSGVTPNANGVNRPLPAGSDGMVVRQEVERSWLPALERFKPDMLFISAGFDAHQEDPLGQMRLVEDDYAWLTRQAMAVADRFSQGRIVSCLEGGYNLSALARSVHAHVQTLLDA